MSQEQLEERDGESGSEYKEMMSMARAHCQMNGLLEERTRLEEALTRGKPERILRIFRTEVEGMPYDSQQEKADKDLAISVYNFTDEALKKMKESKMLRRMLFQVAVAAKLTKEELPEQIKECDQQIEMVDELMKALYEEMLEAKQAKHGEAAAKAASAEAEAEGDAGKRKSFEGGPSSVV